MLEPPAASSVPSLAATALAAVLLSSTLASAETPRAALRYPKPPLSDQVDEYHGTKVPDPYRALENPDAPETRKWISAQKAVTTRYLAEIPERDAIRKRLTELWNFERYSPPFREGGRYFFTKNDGLQNQAVLYVLEKLGETPRALLDPNGFSKDGTVSLSGYSVSRDGKKLAYGMSSGGSDWTEWRVRDVKSGQDGPDDLKWMKFSTPAFAADGKGFYYSRYAAPAAGQELEAINKNQKLYFHRLGDPQEKDVLVYERPDDPDLGFSSEVTEDGRYLVLTVWKGTDRRNRLYYKDLAAKDPARPESRFVRLFDDFDANYQFVGNDGPVFWIKTDRGAPKGRLVAVDTSKAELAVLSATCARVTAAPPLADLIPESGFILSGVGVVGDRFVVMGMEDASERARIHKLDGSFEKEIELPAAGTLFGFYGKRSDRETFFAFTSFVYPTTIYRYDFATGTRHLFRSPTLKFDPNAYETNRVFAESKDGTKVPVFLVHKKGLAWDGTAPTYLYAYGGFNAAMTPAFSVRALAWLEKGGVYAQACLRGGSEYGEEWHRAGMLENKQNVFDDFIAAAEFLVKKNVTSPKKLAIVGGSNGGLLVGAVLNQRPELFGAAVPQVGVMDMLRFHKFTIGWAWVSEYGSADDPEQFKWLYAYSPLHNIKKGASYPPTFIVTADHDDRVVPAHSFKYAATLQAAQGGDAPILIRIETRAGHGAGKPTNKQIEEAADTLGFLVKALGVKAPPIRLEQ